jgi:hypothetical protein
MASMMATRTAARPLPAAKPARVAAISRGRVVKARAAAASEDMGFKTMRDGVKVAAEETLLTPRFYTTCVGRASQPQNARARAGARAVPARPGRRRPRPAAPPVQGRGRRRHGRAGAGGRANAAPAAADPRAAPRAARPCPCRRGATHRAAPALTPPPCAPSPRPPCSDFDEMEQIFSQQINPNLDMAELDAMLAEFRNDYNQRHFVRNETFKVRTRPAWGRRAARGRCG